MIVTPNYTYQNTPLSYRAGTSAASMLGLGAAAFGMGYLRSMSKADKLGMQTKIRSMLGLPPKTPAAPTAPSTPQAPAAVTTATPTPVDPSGQTPDPSQLPGNGGIASDPDSERLDTSNISSIDNSGDGGYASSWNSDESADSSAPIPVYLTDALQVQEDF